MVTTDSVNNNYFFSIERFFFKVSGVGSTRILIKGSMLWANRMSRFFKICWELFTEKLPNTPWLPIRDLCMRF